MNLSDLGEFGLISRIGKMSRIKTASMPVGIGDDAAALKLPASRHLLATTDLLIEGVHFDLSFTDFYSLGWKSAAVNLSDIAAMGGVPRFCLTALGIPASLSVRQVLEFYRGLGALLERTGTVLAGGDTSTSPRGLFVSITLLGEAKPAEIVARSGAKPGDLIFVTGTLGDSGAGLELLRMGHAECGMRSKRRTATKSKGACQYLVDRHLRPVPRLKEGRALALARCASSMIDVSDGLSSDLFHICEQSGVGAEIDAARIPLSPALRAHAGHQPDRALDHALSGGEDYELLFTVPKNRVKKLRALGLAVSEIGAITTGGNMLLHADGKTRLLRPGGYDHFSRDRDRKAARAGAGRHRQ